MKKDKRFQRLNVGDYINIILIDTLSQERVEYRGLVEKEYKRFYLIKKEHYYETINKGDLGFGNISKFYTTHQY